MQPVMHNNVMFLKCFSVAHNPSNFLLWPCENIVITKSPLTEEDFLHSVAAKVNQGFQLIFIVDKKCII